MADSLVAPVGEVLPTKSPQRLPDACVYEETMKKRERILIVDDDALTIAAVSGLLCRRGYEVASAGTGVAALDVLRREPVGLTLLDIRLRAEDGLDLLPQLKLLCRKAYPATHLFDNP